MKKQSKEMLTLFWKSIKRDKEAISLITPKHYLKDVQTIHYKELKRKGIQNLVFDIDNTILPVNKIEVTKELKDFFMELKKNFTICLLSNNTKQRVKPVAEKLQVLSVWKANKPSGDAYNKLKQKITITNNNTAMIGDQMLSDIVFGNKYKLYSILVEPVKKKYDIKTGTSRILQNFLMKRKKIIKRYHYY